MTAHTIRRFLLAALLVPFACAHASAAGFAERLAEADRVRTSDMARYSQLLEELVRTQDTATDSQRRHLRLLQSHYRTLLGQFEAAVGEAVALVDEAPEPELKYRAALLVANISALNRDYVFGLRYLDRALALQKDVADPALRHSGDAVAGTLFNEFGHHEQALGHADRMLATAPAPRDRCMADQIRLHALQALGRALDEDGDVRPAIAGCLALKEMIAVVAIRTTLAEHWASRGRSQQALALLQSTLPDAEKTRYTRLIAEVRSLLARYSLDHGDAVAAKTHAEAVMKASRVDVQSRAYVLAQHVLYLVALQRGHLDAALHHYRLHAEADKARLNDIRAREYAFQLTRHEIAQKNQSIQLLSNQNQVLRLQQDLARRSAWNFRLAITLLLVLAASAAYWGWRARRTHRSLRQLADTDGLTGLSNRRHFRACSEAVLAQCALRARPVSMLLFDLDHFKQINDQCGHSTGDWVLREVARVVRRHCREGDLFGRIGGEEYAMTLVDCDVDAALRIAEQCRVSIEAIDADTAGCALPVAASIGAVGTSMSGYDYETLIAHADAAMYRSKVAGRNRVSLYEPPPLPEHGHHAVLDSRNAAAMLKEY